MGMLTLEHLLIVIVDAYTVSGIVNRQIGIKKFIRVVILDPLTAGHVTQRMRNPKIAMVRYVTAKRLSYDIAGISETTSPIDKKV